MGESVLPCHCTESLPYIYYKIVLEVQTKLTLYYKEVPVFPLPCSHALCRMSAEPGVSYRPKPVVHCTMH